MSDTNFRQGAGADPERDRTGVTPGYTSGSGMGAGSGSSSYAAELSPQHPRGSGRSHEASRRDSSRHEQGYMEQASDMADDVWRTGQEYYDEGTRRVSRWASDHPNQMWAFVAAAGAFALWMAYRPLMASLSGNRDFDASRNRYRRFPRPSGRDYPRM